MYYVFFSHSSFVLVMEVLVIVQVALYEARGVGAGIHATRYLGVSCFIFHYEVPMRIDLSLLVTQKGIVLTVGLCGN